MAMANIKEDSAVPKVATEVATSKNLFKEMVLIH